MFAWLQDRNSSLTLLQWGFSSVKSYLDLSKTEDSWKFYLVNFNIYGHYGKFVSHLNKNVEYDFTQKLYKIKI